MPTKIEIEKELRKLNTLGVVFRYQGKPQSINQIINLLSANSENKDNEKAVLSSGKFYYDVAIPLHYTYFKIIIPAGDGGRNISLTTSFMSYVRLQASGLDTRKGKYEKKEYEKCREILEAYYTAMVGGDFNNYLFKDGGVPGYSTILAKANINKFVDAYFSGTGPKRDGKTDMVGIGSKEEYQKGFEESGTIDEQVFAKMYKQKKKAEWKYHVDRAFGKLTKQEKKGMEITRIYNYIDRV